MEIGMISTKLSILGATNQNTGLFRTTNDITTLVDYIKFDHYQPGRYLQLSKTSGQFRIAEIEMTFSNMCMY